MPDSLRTLTFGDVERGAWGAAWLPGPQATGLLVIGIGDAGTGYEVAFEDSGDELRLRAEGLELIATPEGPAIELVDEDGAPAGSERLCAVTLALGPDSELRLPGRHGEHPLGVMPDKLDSAREVSAWFDGTEGVAVLALRARKQRGQEQDAVRAVVIEAENPPSITDPRLSTTYSASGRPTRMTLELWSEEPEQYPRRFAGESAGRAGEVSGGGWTVSAELMRCHSRGRDGTGVYVLARPA
jgi:hypothetical protein